MCICHSVLNILRAKSWGECLIFSIALFIRVTENQAPCLKLLETMESQMSFSQAFSSCSIFLLEVELRWLPVPKAVASLKQVYQNWVTDVVRLSARMTHAQVYCWVRGAQNLLQWGTIQCRGDCLKRYVCYSAVETLMLWEYFVLR